MQALISTISAGLVKSLLKLESQTSQRNQIIHTYQFPNNGMEHQRGSTLFPTWISNHMPNRVWE